MSKRNYIEIDDREINDDYMRGRDHVYDEILSYIVHDCKDVTVEKIKEYIEDRISIEACPRCKGR